MEEAVLSSGISQERERTSLNNFTRQAVKILYDALFEYSFTNNDNKSTKAK